VEDDAAYDTSTSRDPAPFFSIPVSRTERVRQRSTGKRHQRHGNPQLHRCGKCGRGFHYPKDVTRHEDTVHKGDKPYSCRRCSMVFNRKDNRKRHEESCRGLGTSSHRISKSASSIHSVPKIQRTKLEDKCDNEPASEPPDGRRGNSRQSSNNFATLASSTNFNFGDASKNWRSEESHGNRNDPNVTKVGRGRSTVSQYSGPLWACPDWRHLNSPSDSRCNKGFQSEARLLEHLMRTHKKPWCIICLYRFTTTEEWKSHCGQGIRQPCYDCRIKCYTTKEDLVTHRDGNCDKILRVPTNERAAWQYRYKRDYPNDTNEPNPCK
jgi:uncharacterized C2H2 Zn-finger protein